MVSIAIFGLNGILGKPTLDALQTTFKAKVTAVKAVTRSKKSPVEGVEYVEADISDASQLDKIASELAGVDAIVELVGPNPAVYANIEKVVAQVKPKVFIPSQFGTDWGVAEEVFPGILQLKSPHSEAVRKAGVKVVDIYTSFFFAPGGFSYEIVAHWGITDNSVVQLGDPNTQASATSTVDVGNVIAAVATYGDYAQLPDVIRVQSDTLTFAEVQHTYAQNHNVELKTVKTLSKEEALDEGRRVWSEGFNPAKFLFYLQVLASQGKGLYFSSTDNELLNPGESVWQWTKFERK